MKKKFFLSLMIVSLTLQTSPIPLEARTLNNSSESTLNSSAVSPNPVIGRTIYLEDGEGTKNSGNGTQDSPYQNIRTALANAQDGDILKLIGTVQYAHYETLPNKAAKPLIIDKNITVEGVNESSGLRVRTAIQLGADVTFRNMKLQMIGTAFEGNDTIFAAGHSLTIDNVNTMPSTNQTQNKNRSRISGGTYEGVGEAGSKAVIRVVNPSSETKFQTIYAGDYWVDRNLDVEIDLEGYIFTQKNIYLGGINKVLNGNVILNLNNKTNIENVIHTNQNGNITVRLKKGFFGAGLNLEGIDDLIMESTSKLTCLPSSVFQVKNVTLNEKAVIDFRSMTNAPSITGNFTGTEVENDLENTGAVLLSNQQTLQIDGLVDGLTKLNYDGIQNFDSFIDGHVYIRANNLSTGGFSIAGTKYTNFALQREQEGQSFLWKTKLNPNANIDTFERFEWSGGQDTIIKPNIYETLYYPVIFYNRNGEAYKPNWMELYQKYEYNLERKDGKEIDLDNDVLFQWDTDSPDSEPYQLLLELDNLDQIYGELVLSVKHLESGKKISRTIEFLAQEPNEEPSKQPEITPTVISKLSSPKPIIIQLNKSNVKLYTTGTTSFQLNATVTGANKRVKYSSSNNSIAKVDSSGIISAVAPGMTTIYAELDGTKASCIVTVVKPSLKLNISKATIYTAGKNSLYIKPSIIGESHTVTYKSSNTKVAKVDKTGKVLGLKVGTAEITVTANNVSEKCVITVKKAELRISKTSYTIKQGQKVTITVKAVPSGTLVFTSSNKKIASVNRKGVLTGVKAGTTKITVTCNGITKIMSIKVMKK